MVGLVISKKEKHATLPFHTSYKQKEKEKQGTMRQVGFLFYFFVNLKMVRWCDHGFNPPKLKFDMI